MLLTTVTVLPITSPGLIYFRTGILHFWTPSTLLTAAPPPQATVSPSQTAGLPCSPHAHAGTRSFGDVTEGWADAAEAVTLWYGRVSNHAHLKVAQHYMQIIFQKLGKKGWGITRQKKIKSSVWRELGHYINQLLFSLQIALVPAKEEYHKIYVKLLFKFPISNFSCSKWYPARGFGTASYQVK